MLERAHVGSTLIPLTVMWVAIILGVTLLVDTPSVRVSMAVIGVGATVGVLLRSWMQTRNA